MEKHLTEMIRNSEDGVPPTEADRADIESSNCLNCHQPFNDMQAIMFSRLGNGNLLWWHVFRCGAKIPETK